MKRPIHTGGKWTGGIRGLGSENPRHKSAAVRRSVVGAVAAALGTSPVPPAPLAVADPQSANPAIHQTEPPNPLGCTGGPDDTACTRAGDAELHSAPNPADIPPVPQAEVPPWVVFGNPGMGH